LCFTGQHKGSCLVPLDGRTWQSYKQNLEANIARIAFGHTSGHLPQAGGMTERGDAESPAGTTDQFRAAVGERSTKWGSLVLIRSRL
jgi:hypothetical protein